MDGQRRNRVTRHLLERGGAKDQLASVIRWRYWKRPTRPQNALPTYSRLSIAPNVRTQA